MEKYKQLFSFFFFIALAAVIIYPLSKSGYILTLDAVITPKVLFAPLTSSSFIYQNILAVLNLFLPSDLIERIILFLIFFLSGWGMYRLTAKNLGVARFFAGIFYAVNPYVYGRVMAGHWQLLLGYSIFPFVVSSVINFFHDTSKKNTVWLAFIATLLFNIAIHYLLIFLVFFITLGIIYAYFHQDNRERLNKIIRQTIIFTVITFILNANWIISSILGNSDISQSISQFTGNDLISFQSVADGRWGLIFNLLSGYGFWAEVYHYFVLPKDIIIFWPVIAIFFMGIAFWGWLKAFQEGNKINKPFIITGAVLFLIALDLAGGVALKPIANTVFYLYDKIPFLRGLREPQKLIGILLFYYAYFGSTGLHLLLNRIKNRSFYFALCSLFLLALPFIYTPTVFGGFWGQLRPVFYPSSWEKVNQILKDDKNDFLTLFFPWHQYMKFNFNGERVITNPAPYFFSKPVLSSQNYETNFLFTHDVRTEALHIEGLLSIEKEGVNLLGDAVESEFSWGQSLSPINVKYIILSKDEDWKKYRFLDEQTDLSKVYEDDDLVLYQNLKWEAKDQQLEEINFDEPLPPLE